MNQPNQTNPCPNGAAPDDDKLTLLKMAPDILKGMEGPPDPTFDLLQRSYGHLQGGGTRAHDDSEHEFELLLAALDAIDREERSRARSNGNSSGSSSDSGSGSSGSGNPGGQ